MNEQKKQIIDKIHEKMIEVEVTADDLKTLRAQGIDEADLPAMGIKRYYPARHFRRDILTVKASLLIGFCFLLSLSACVAKDKNEPPSNSISAPPPQQPTISTTPMPPAPKDAKDTAGQIQKIVAKLLDLNPNEVPINTPLAKLKKPADELDVVEIIMTVEETFNIEIKDDELGGSDINAVTNITVQQLADLVESRKKEK